MINVSHKCTIIDFVWNRNTIITSQMYYVMYKTSTSYVQKKENGTFCVHILQIHYQICIGNVQGEVQYINH